jgi:hypothetical protein
MAPRHSTDNPFIDDSFLGGANLPAQPALQACGRFPWNLIGGRYLVSLDTSECFLSERSHFPGAAGNPKVPAL